MKVKTSELTGKALDYAVCLAKGLDLRHSKAIGWYVQLKDSRGAIPPYSTSWAYGGPLIEREGLDLEFYEGPEWGSRVRAAQDINQYARTPLEAAMKAYVASKLGEEVEIPDNLSE